MPKQDDRKKRAAAINRLLAKEYPEAKCSLNFASPFQLLVATILSAQCTDERVNMVTPALFKKYPSPRSLAAAPLNEIEEAIRTTGFFHNKAKSLKGMAEGLVARHHGQVPARIEDLTELPGVGRKTANVVLGNCFDTPGITVDTHVSRVSQRLGLARSDVQDKIEQDLMEVIPRKDWTHFSHRIIYHGRRLCQARKPLCEQCPLSRYCDYFRQR
jgi:endonuclease III